MSIGIIGAMRIEVEELKSRMKNIKVDRISQMEFYTGELFGKEAVVAVSGVGKVNAAMCAQTMILKYNPEIIINTGVAGGIAKGVRIGDVVIGKAVVQHDMDTSALGDPVGLISGINVVEIPCTELVVEKLKKAAENIENLNIYTGTIATGDQFINSNEQSNLIAERFNAMACEMEGGSIGQVCYINGVDFAIVRAISDNGDDESHMDFEEFVRLAAKNSIEMMTNFLATV